MEVNWLPFVVGEDFCFLNVSGRVFLDNSRLTNLEISIMSNKLYNSKVVFHFQILVLDFNKIIY